MYRITIHDNDTNLDTQMIFADSSFHDVFNTMHDLTKHMPNSELELCWVKDKQETYLVRYLSSKWAFCETVRTFLN